MSENQRFKTPIAFIVMLLLVSVLALNNGASSHVTALYIRAEPTQLSITLPIILYHKILNSKQSKNSLTISPKQFENDLKFLKDNGFTTVFVADIMEYVDNASALPDKPVLIMFDDGHYNNYHYAYPLLKEYGMRAVISVVGEYAETATQNDDVNPNYSYLTWDHIAELSRTGVFEFANHTYDMHKTKGKRFGCLKLKSETDEEYDKRLTEDLMKLQVKLNNTLGYFPQSFAYPFGSVCKQSQPPIMRIFRASMNSIKGLNTVVSGSKDSLYMLKRIDRTRSSSEDFFGKWLKSLL